MDKKAKLNKVLQFPLTKISIGLVVVAIATVLVQSGTQAIAKHILFNEDIKNLLVAILSAATALFTYLYLFRFYEKRKIEELSTTHFLRNSLTGFSTGFLILSIVILVMYFGKAYTILSVNPASFLIPALAIGVSSAIFEEILFRGIIFRITEQRLGTIWEIGRAHV